MTVKRRTVLGSLAAGCVGVLAGCSSQEEESTPTETTAERTESTTTESRPDPQEEDGWRELRDQFGFEERVNAVDDLGWDPDGTQPVNGSLTESFDRNVLVEVPPGTYNLVESFGREELSNWGMRGLGENRTDVEFTTQAGTRVEFEIDGARDILLENFTFQLGDQFDRSIGMSFFVEDNLQIHNVEKAGANPTENPSGVSTLALNVVDPDGVAVVDTLVRTGPQVFLPYPNNELCVFSGVGHEGTVKYRNLQIANAGENGIYASKCPGEVHVEGGTYTNNRNDGIRISGRGSYIKGATVVIDSDNFHPMNRGVEGNMRGIRMQSGDMGYTGGLIEDTHLELRSTFRTQSLVHIAHNQGRMTMRNSDLWNWTDFFSFRAEAPSAHVRKPLGVILRDVTLTEYGESGTAFKLEKRPNSTLRNVSIESRNQNGFRDGIIVYDSEGTVFEDVTVRTSGIPIRIERPTGPLENYSLEFKGQNEFAIENDRFMNSSVDFSLGSDETVYPFREADDDVEAVQIVGSSADSIEFQQMY